MNHNARRSKEPLDEKFEFAFRDNFLNDGSKPNKCINNLTRGKAPHDWRGPIVVMKFQLQRYSEKYLDMTMEDTTQIIDFLLEYGSREAPLPDFLKDFSCMRL